MKFKSKFCYRQNTISTSLYIILTISTMTLFSSADAQSNNSDQSLYLFKGPVEHIFFHPLIAYPKRAFDNDSHSKFMDDWFVTVDEFKRVIENVYKNGYVLINISSVYTVENVNDTKKLVRKPLYIPKGKKPLILSVDDLNYYKSMIENGTVSKLIIDKNNIIASLSKDDQNNNVISYENEIIPILNKFIEKHPDFSINGAKGIIALTGYHGIFGYHTAGTSKYSKTEQEEVKPIIEALKHEGWSFASHGYFHEHINDVDINRLEKDSDLWENEVESLVGPTNVYIFPFGEIIENDNLKLLSLRDKGFSIFVGISGQTYEKFSDNTVLLMRRHVDGIALRQQRLLNLHLFDANNVIDLTTRPKR